MAEPEPTKTARIRIATHHRGPLTKLENADKLQIYSGAAMNILGGLKIGLQEGAWLAFTALLFFAGDNIRWEKSTDPEPPMWKVRVALAEFFTLMESWSRIPFIPKEILSPAPVWNPLYPFVVMMAKDVPLAYLAGKDVPGIPYREYKEVPMMPRLFIALMVPWMMRFFLEHLEGIFNGIGAIIQGLGQIVPG